MICLANSRTEAARAMSAVVFTRDGSVYAMHQTSISPDGNAISWSFEPYEDTTVIASAAIDAEGRCVAMNVERSDLRVEAGDLYTADYTVP